MFADTHGTQVRNSNTDCWTMISLLDLDHLTNACRDFFDFSMSLTGILTGIVCFSNMCTPPPPPTPLQLPAEVVRRPRNHIVMTLQRADSEQRARRLVAGELAR
eukprot:COSAG06_NODE_3743_length_4953_cov_2.166049_2_plen_104_part_00